MLDWTKPLQFEGGREAVLHATLSRTGKAKFENGRASEHSDLWAELAEQGITRLVTDEHHVKLLAYGEDGRPIEPWGAYEEGITSGPKPLVNAPPVSDASMAAMAEHELWGMF